MKETEFIEKMEAAWDVDGFLYSIRNGEFDPKIAEEFITLISSAPSDNKETLNKRLVSVLWFLAPFLEWQKERIAEGSSSQNTDYKKFVMRTIEILQDKLGLP